MSGLLGLIAVLICGLVLVLRRAPMWILALAALALTAAGQFGLFAGHLQYPSLTPLAFIAWLPAALLIAMSIASLRRAVIVVPIYRQLRRSMPRFSVVAQQTVDAGTVGFEAELFSGKPDWSKLRAIPAIALTNEEQAFLDGTTEELCRVIDDWKIRRQREIPSEVWSFLKSQGFFGLSIAREYDGLGFSPQAVSLILGKIASRSLDVFAVLLIPNTLGLGEFIQKHGTDDQKRRYLPALAIAKDIPCFAVTGPSAGSETAAMQDVGFVTRGQHNGRDTVGIRLSWDKRFIALAPCATLIGLAVHLFDPDRLLGGEDDLGITIVLVPADYPGISIGRQHLPSGSMFPIGPTSAENVFVPVTSIVGGAKMAGQGWRLMLEGVSASRAIAFPASATACIKQMLRVTTAYGRVRRQFGAPIAKMEGPEEALARIAEAAYVCEAARATTATMIGRGEQPPVISALMKYQTTERCRLAVNDAMDIHGGRGVFDGPTNYLQSAFQMIPGAITADGANIVARALITFTQGVVRAHPYFLREMQACRDSNEKRGLRLFESALLGHVSFLLSNLAGAWLHNMTAGRLIATPRQTNSYWYRQLSRACRSFALVSDAAVLLLGPAGLRRKQKLTGRLADALSELFLLACALKRYEDDGEPDDDHAILELTARNGLYRFQQAMRGTLDNFPAAWARALLKCTVFPFGLPYRPAPDWLGHKAVQTVLEPSVARDRLTRFIYVSKDESDAMGLLELALEKTVRADASIQAVERAVRKGLLRRYRGNDWVEDAQAQGIISPQQAESLREIEALTARVIAVDHFDPDEIKPHYMSAGHNIKAMQD